MEGYESIILQMNKERLRLERQFSQLMKASFMQFFPIIYLTPAVIFLKLKKDNINDIVLVVQLAVLLTVYVGQHHKLMYSHVMS